LHGPVPGLLCGRRDHFPSVGELAEDRAGTLSIAHRRISVVVPTYNRAQLIQEAIDSVLRQTAPVDEIIVVDDGSTDSTCELVRAYGDPVILLRDNHRGAAAARNRGFARATGDWTAFLDSDDVWAPTKLEKQLQYLDRHPECGFVHTGYYEFGDHERVVPGPSHFVSGDHRVEHLLFAAGWICTSAVLVRQNVPVRFREWASSSAEDIIFFGDLLKAGIQFGYVDKALVGHRLHACSANREAGSQACGLSVQWRWILETFASEPEEQRRLRDDLLSKVVHAMAQARSCRDWPRYWEWRHWLEQSWPPDLPRPESLNERIYPPILYDLKDRVEKLVPRILSEHTDSPRR
jgi:glycosyltransferase involved in cell wall biosynthesis